MKDIFYTRVSEFFDAFDCRLDTELQAKLIEEELNEFIEAASLVGHNSPTIEELSNFLKESCDVLFVSIGMKVIEDRLDLEPALRVSDEAAMKTIVYLGIVESLNESTEGIFDKVALKVFHKVCDSNMTKLDDAGNPVRDATGKVVKGKNYVAPDLTEEAQTLRMVWPNMAGHDRIAA